MNSILNGLYNNFVSIATVSLNLSFHKLFANIGYLISQAYSFFAFRIAVKGCCKENMYFWSACNPYCQLSSLGNTTLQSIMNEILTQHRFWPCHENGLIKTIQTIPHTLLSVKLTYLCCGLRLILTYPNPQ